MSFAENAKEYTFPRPSFFDLNPIFDCGQCFRFEKTSEENVFEGIAYDRYLRLKQEDNFITIYGADSCDFEKIWKRYFSLDSDYSLIRQDIAAHFLSDQTILSAMEYGKGIRILRQDPWETLCSFILSQNNNIPRIKKLIASLSEALGNPIPHGEKMYYSFPSAEALYDAGETRLYALKTGFRAAYLFDAAKKVRNKEFSLEELTSVDTPALLSELMKIKGVGPKVASCVALFGFGKTDAFPIDVWVKRVLAKHYPGGLDIAALGNYAGIAQQYLFYYERYSVEKAVS